MTSVLPGGAARTRPTPTHPNWREYECRWAWTADGRVASLRTCEHPVRQVRHEVLALLHEGQAEVVQRSTHLGVLAAPWPGMSPALKTAFGQPRTARRLIIEHGADTLFDTRDDVVPISMTGAVEMDTGDFALDDTTGGVMRTSWGIAPVDVPTPPTTRPASALPQRLWFRATFHREATAVHVVVFEDEHGAVVHSSVEGLGETAPMASGPLTLVWRPGTRRLERAVVTVDPGDPITLTSIVTVPTALLGGLGADWPLGAWVGDAAVARRSHPLDEPLEGLAGVEHEHLCAVDGLPGCTRAIVELTALGPHAPSGLTGWTDAT